MLVICFTIKVHMLQPSCVLFIYHYLYHLQVKRHSNMMTTAQNLNKLDWVAHQQGHLRSTENLMEPHRQQNLDNKEFLGNEIFNTWNQSWESQNTRAVAQINFRRLQSVSIFLILKYPCISNHRVTSSIWN